jgi:hypothetical protein
MNVQFSRLLSLSALIGAIALTSCRIAQAQTLAPPANTTEKPAAPPVTEAPKTAVTPAVKSAPKDFVDLQVGFITIRKHKTLAPRTYLFVDLTKLDAERYQFLNPEDPASYALVRPTGNDTPSRTEAAKLAMGITPPAINPADADSIKDPAKSEIKQPEKPKSPINSIKAPEIEGMLLPGQKSDTPVFISKSVVTQGVARLSVQGMVRGDQLRLTLKNVSESINMTLAPANPSDANRASLSAPAVPPDENGAPVVIAPPETQRVSGSRTVDLTVRNIVTVQENIGATFRPNIVFQSNQKLSNGESKGLYQIPLYYEQPSLREKGGFNYFLRSDTVLSSDSRDISSRLNLTYGRERNVSRSETGMIPEHSELHFDANQKFSNASLGVGFGIKRNLGRNYDPLWNAALKSETYPILSHDFAIDYRLKRDLDAAPGHGAHWGIFYSPAIEGPATKLFRMPGTNQSVEAIYNIRAWFLPFERGSNGHSARYFETAGTIGVLIPLPRILGSDRRLRIDYRSGANPTSGFQRSQSFSFRLVGGNASLADGR